MVKNDMVAGLDIGSSNIICVIGRLNENNSIDIISSGKKVCHGIKMGTVVDINETAECIKSSLEEAEEKIDEVIDNVYLGIRGTHIETHNSRGVVSISRTDKEITSDDVTSAIENSKAIQISNEREIIDTIPQEYSLDKQKGVHNPVGMEGHFLEVYVHIVTASQTHLNNVYKAIAKAGFNVIEPIYGLLATGDVAVTKEEKDLGCMLLDMGGQLTGLAIYIEGSVRYSRELPFGTDLITKDLSHALRTSFNQAQYIKETYSLSMPGLIKKDSEIEFTAVDGRTIKKTTLKYLAEIVAARLEEIFDRVDTELQNTAYADAVVPGGIILTGGGSLLQGIDGACEKMINIPVRLGLPQNISGKGDIISNPCYTTGIGLIKYRPSIETSRSKRFIRKMPLLKRIRDWFQ